MPATKIWDQVKASGVDPWLVNEQFLNSQLESGVERIDFVGEDASALLAEYDGVALPPYRVREINWLLENAEMYGYVKTVGAKLTYKLLV